MRERDQYELWHSGDFTHLPVSARQIRTVLSSETGWKFAEATQQISTHIV